MSNTDYFDPIETQTLKDKGVISSLVTGGTEGSISVSSTAVTIKRGNTTGVALMIGPPKYGGTMTNLRISSPASSFCAVNNTGTMITVAPPVTIAPGDYQLTVLVNESGLGGTIDTRSCTLVIYVTTDAAVPVM